MPMYAYIDHDALKAHLCKPVEYAKLETAEVTVQVICCFKGTVCSNLPLFFLGKWFCYHLELNLYSISIWYCIVWYHVKAR